MRGRFSGMWGRRSHEIAAVAALVLLVLYVYAPVFKFGFIFYDDQLYVTDNRYVKGGLTPEGIRWAFTNGDVGHWHPLTWLSHMADVELFGLDPAFHHGMNLFLHLLNTLLLIVLLEALTGDFWRALAVSALFALHPINVESVAWVTERKNVLSATFWFLTLLLYTAQVRRGGLVHYLGTLFVFALGLMAKPMLVTVPFVLLLLDYWPLGRWGEGIRSLGKLIAEKMPFFVLTALSVWATLHASVVGGSLRSWEEFPLADRLQNLVLAYGIYLRKLLWPADLAVFYPFPKAFSPSVVFFSGCLLTTLTWFAWARRRSLPFLIVGWLWYLGTLLPVIGIVQVGSQAMADRYAYIPAIGLFAALAWGMPALFKRIVSPEKANYWKWSLSAVTIGVCLALAVSASRQVDYWRDNLTLFTRALEVTRDNQKAHHGLGLAWHERGRVDLAVYHLRESLRLKEDPWVRNDLGYVLMCRGRYGEAEAEFRKALAGTGKNPKFASNLGAALAAQGKKEEARALFLEALRLDPHYLSARENLKKLGQDDVKR
ncbi:MAG TPA: tetratricopeptide repeat protein [Syntrophales bacterium]|nr:tetratricopeptide repeat protein [Syntrophales bacterium]HOM08116.1 tetratricopeptide repeat protein [Syntrophales bacterium]HOO00788.1 tetratricopeptide repeat protein [Syntrophales bacterium]HRS49043.1 tetratricopeptide repeat protein [Thermovirgaceae bacterium]